MKITDLKEQKNNSDRISVHVDGKYSFSLSTNDLLAEKLRVGNELQDTDIERYKQLSTDSLLLSRTYEKCLRRPHSVKEIRDYLRTKKAGEDLSESIISKCLDKNLLDDDYFAERWVEHRKKSGKSNRYIQNELRSKGVASDIIERHVHGGDQDQLRILIDKKRSKYSDEKKLITYLQRQGFRYSDIEQSLRGEVD